MDHLAHRGHTQKFTSFEVDHPSLSLPRRPFSQSPVVDLACYAVQPTSITESVDRQELAVLLAAVLDASLGEVIEARADDPISLPL